MKAIFLFITLLASLGLMWSGISEFHSGIPFPVKDRSSKTLVSLACLGLLVIGRQVAASMGKANAPSDTRAAPRTPDRDPEPPRRPDREIEGSDELEMRAAALLGVPRPRNAPARAPDELEMRAAAMLDGTDLPSVKQNEEISAKSVSPATGEYFRGGYNMKVAHMDDLTVTLTIYGRCLQGDIHNGGQITARCFSKLCPDGESGYVATSSILQVIGEEEFDKAKGSDWD